MIPDVTSAYVEMRGGSPIAEKAEAVTAVSYTAIRNSDISTAVHVDTGALALTLRTALSYNTVVDIGGDSCVAH